MRFTFKTSYQRQHDNIGTASAEGRPDLELSPPPQFRGPQGYWTPEDLFVEAVESCLFLTFLGLVKRSELQLVDYASQATGTLERTDKGLMFTKVEIKPMVQVRENAQLALELLGQAEKGCLVANSLACEVHLEPQVVEVPAAQQVPT